MKGVCLQARVNSHAPDFACDLDADHTTPHRDPRTGLRWGHPALPYGVRKPRNKNIGHARTKPRSWWSAAPVVGYSNGGTK